MARPLLVLVTVAFLFVAGAYGIAPPITSSYKTYLTGTQFQFTINFGLVYFEFDRNLTLIDPRDGVLKTIDQIKGMCPSAVSESGSAIQCAANDTLTISCPNVNINFTTNSMSNGGGDGPPVYGLVSAGADDPLPTLLTAFQAYDFYPNRPKYANQMFVLLILGMSADGVSMESMTEAQWAACNPVVTFGGSSLTGKIHYVGGGADFFDGTITVTAQRSPPCDGSSMAELATNFNTFIQTSKGGTAYGTNTGRNQIEMTFLSFTSSYPYNGCRKLVDSYLTLTNTTTTIISDNCFVNNRSDPLWLNDPCCNWALAQVECCVPKSVTTTFKTLSGVNDVDINSDCSDPDRVSSVLKDYVNEMNSIGGGFTFSANDEQNRLRQAYYDCQNKQYADCSSDSQCLEGVACEASTSRCQYTPGNDVPLIKCIVDNIDPAVRYELARLLGFSSNYTRDQMVAAFRANVSLFDCVGPTAWQYTAQRVDYRDPETGQWVHNYTSGDEVGCLTNMRCNWDYWAADQAACEDPNLTTYFCGDCWGGGNYCNEVSQFPKCRTGFYDQAECQNNGLIWNNWNCLKPAATEAECLGDPHGIVNCSYNNGSGGYDSCYNTFCYGAPELVVYPSTLGCPPNSWILTNGGCAWYPNNGENSDATCSSYVLLANAYYWYPRYFDGQARRADNASCSAGSCLHNYWSDLTKADCATTMYCTTDCWKCHSSYFYNWTTGAALSAGCFNATATAADCNADPNQYLQYSWDWNTNTQTSLCIPWTQVDQATCASMGLIWGSCSGTSYDTCSAGTYQSQLMCRIDFYQCTNAECPNYGRCQDWDHYTYADGGFGYGACVVPAPPDQYGNTWCDWNAGYGWMQDPKKCKINNAFDAATCAQYNGTWEAAALTQAQCNSYPSACKGEWSQTNRMNATECKKCNYESAPLYAWNAGQLAADTPVDFYWRPRQWTSENSWIQVSQWYLMEDLMNVAIGRIVGREFFNLANKAFTSFLSLTEAVACSCAQSASSCFTSYLTSPIATIDVVPGRTAEGGGSDGGALVCTDCASSEDQIEVEKIFVGSLTDPNATVEVTVGKKRVSLGNEYAVVKNSNGAQVGQVVGNGVKLSSTTGSTSSVEITVSQRNDITVTDGFTIPAIVEVNDAGDVSVLSAQVVFNPPIMKYNATNLNGGTYVPAMVSVDWQTKVGPTPTAAVTLSVPIALMLLLCALFMF